MVREASLAWTPVPHHMHGGKMHVHVQRVCEGRDVCCYWCAGSTDGSETGSDEGSPLGPKGGGTLKTCAICIEDYRYGVKVTFHSLVELAPYVNSFMAWRCAFCSRIYTVGWWTGQTSCTKRPLYSTAQFRSQMVSCLT